MRKRLMTKNNEAAEYEFSNPLRDAAIEMHVMFTELRRAGFSKREALHLVSQVLVGSVLAGMDDTGEDPYDEE